MEKQPTPPAGELRAGQINTAHLVAFVIACAAPLTLMAGVAPVAIGIGGIGAPSGYLLGMIVLGLFAVGYVAMSRYMRDAGAFYAFIGSGLGAPAGTGAAYLTLLSYFMFAIGQTAGCAVFAQSALAHLFGITIAWPILAIIVAIVIGLLGYRSVTLSANVLGIALLAEVAILILLVAAILLKGGATGISFGSFTPQAMFAPGMGVVLIFTFGAFLGVEATAIYTEEAREPEKSVPRATYLAIAILGIFYTLVCWSIIVGFGEASVAGRANKDPAALFSDAMTSFVGPQATSLMDVLLFVSIFASTLAFHNQSTRYMFSLARGRSLPGRFAQIHLRYGSPYIGVIFQIAVIIAFQLVFAAFGLDPYLQVFIYLASAAVIGIISAQVLCSLAVIVYFWRDPKHTNLWQRLVAPGLSIICLGFVLYLMIAQFDLLTGAPVSVNLVLLAPLALAFVAGFCFRSFRKTLIPTASSM